MTSLASENTTGSPSAHRRAARAEREPAENAAMAYMPRRHLMPARPDATHEPRSVLRRSLRRLLAATSFIRQQTVESKFA
jgi:hypothetical protein